MASQIMKSSEKREKLSEFKYNAAVAEKSAWAWKRVSVPLRPGADGLSIYRKELESLSKRRVLVLGSTPELVDLAVALGSARVVSMELDAETIIAMKSLSKEDWEGVELICGNWLDQRKEFEGDFTFVCSDGGPMFLTFPDQWQRLFEVVHSYLALGGKLVTKAWNIHGKGPDYHDYYAQQVDAFESRRSSLTPDAQVEHFRDMVTALRAAVWLGTSRGNGLLNPEPALKRSNWTLGKLLNQYPEERFREYTEASFECVSPAKNPSMREVSDPSYSMVKPLLDEAGFGSKAIAMPSYPPHPEAYYTIIATKLIIGE